ncbi:MAG: glycosyltransferase [Bacteroidetes bacterium]|nr:glycosyltransferase [Bacteroidota bacterium]
MKVNLISYENVNEWILGKFALRMNDHLISMGIQSVISSTPDPEADINHHIYYEHVIPDHNRQSVETMMITHVDQDKKLKKLKHQLVTMDAGICMSAETMNLLVAHGLDKKRLTWVYTPQDGVIKPRKKNIGITTRLYADGRKREFLIDRLIMTLDPELFSFTIMGGGWESRVSRMKEAGFSVSWFPDFDLDSYQRLIPGLDYYLYTGEDEGQIGVLDALAAGVSVITTPQGYHLDVASGAIPFFFRSENELISVFDSITAEIRQRTGSVSDWTWEKYTKKHLEIWLYLHNKAHHKSVAFSQFQNPDGLNGLINVQSVTLTQKWVLLQKNWKIRWKGKIRTKRKYRFLRPFLRFLES